MSVKAMSECACDRCGRIDSVDQVMGANVFPKGWIGLTVGLQVRDLCADCSRGFLAFMEPAYPIHPGIKGDAE